MIKHAGLHANAVDKHTRFDSVGFRYPGDLAYKERLRWCLTRLSRLKQFQMMIGKFRCAAVFVVYLTIMTLGFVPVRAEERSPPSPKSPQRVAPQEWDNAVRRGVEHLLQTQRKDGAWGGPQWTGGVDNDPVPGAFRSFDVAVTALCLEALMDFQGDQRVRKSRDRAYQFLIQRTNRIRRPGPRDLPNVWAHCYCIQVFVKLLERDEYKTRSMELSDAIKRLMQGLKRWESDVLRFSVYQRIA